MLGLIAPSGAAERNSTVSKTLGEEWHDFCPCASPSMAAPLPATLSRYAHPPLPADYVAPE